MGGPVAATPGDHEGLTVVVGDRFIPGWDPWPLTTRTRFVLWVALDHLAVAVDLALQPAQLLRRC
jgi:hypothetical protein